MARHGSHLRRAAVAQWEVRLRVPDASGAWRIVVASPTGPPLSLVLSKCIQQAIMQGLTTPDDLIP